MALTAAQRGWDGPAIRANIRLGSALVMLAFVVGHLINHAVLLVSIKAANDLRPFLVGPWESASGGAVLLLAALLHYLNALWSIWRRRHLRFTRLEWWQLSLGLTIPVLLMLHVVGIRIAGEALSVTHDYTSVLLMLWVAVPVLAVVQALTLLTVWAHAWIGLRFWTQSKRWYPEWRNALLIAAVLLPALALSGFIAAGNQVRRQAEQSGLSGGGVRRCQRHRRNRRGGPSFGCLGLGYASCVGVATVRCAGGTSLGLAPDPSAPT